MKKIKLIIFGFLTLLISQISYSSTQAERARGLGICFANFSYFGAILAKGGNDPSMWFSLAKEAETYGYKFSEKDFKQSALAEMNKLKSVTNVEAYLNGAAKQIINSCTVMIGAASKM